jgi:hypothetical protein
MPVDRLPNLPRGADVFLDANVFIYTFGGHSNDCRDLLRRCASEEVFGITTLDVINEVTHRLMLTEAVAKGVITKLTALLTDHGEADLATQVPHLRLFGRCRCGDEFCATVYTAPRPERAWGPEHKNIPLDPIEGFLVLDVVNEEIVCIEVLYRDDLRARLLRLFP